MSYFRRYDLLTKNTTLKSEHSPGRYRKLTDDEVCLEWARSRSRLSTSPPASPPSDHANTTGRIKNTKGFMAINPKTKRVTLSESLLHKLKESNVEDITQNQQEDNYSLSDNESTFTQTRETLDDEPSNQSISVNQTERYEHFEKIIKRRIIHCDTTKTTSCSKSDIKETSEPKNEFTLVASSYCFETPSGMEQDTVNNKLQNSEAQPQNNAEVESPVASNGFGKSDMTDEAPENLTNCDRCNTDMSSPQNVLDMSIKSAHDTSEYETCTSSDVSRQSRCSFSDDDTLQSISSDEVQVYLDEKGNKIERSPRLAERMAKDRSRHSSGKNHERTPTGCSKNYGDWTPDEGNSVHNSSLDVSSQTQDRIVIPKIRIINDNGEDSNVLNSTMSDHGLAGSRDVSVDSLNGAITGRSHRSSIDSGTGSDPVRQVHNHFVVVAIDFGTTYSGYAFSFSREKEKIYMMRKWEGGDPGVNNQKTLTSLLLTPEEKFHSFGFSARDTFHNLKPQESKKWHYFEKFKMVLHYSTELNKDTTLRSSNGKLVPALTVFTFALEFFKNHALQELSDMTGTPILGEDIRWVITVPAIWRAQAKQFMRQAAYQAGIASETNPDQLLIALEPEAASVCCRKLRMHQVILDSFNPQTPFMSPKKPTDQTDSQNLEQVLPDNQEDMSHSSGEAIPGGDVPVVDPGDRSMDADLFKGTRYMVVDCGGGTVDITVHEIQDNHGRLRELYKATGGPYGSVGVDIEFEKLLCAIFGTEFIHHFQQKRPAGWDDLMIAFESRKRSAIPDKQNPLNVSLPFSFIDLYWKTKGGQIENAVRKFGDPNIRWSSQGMLRLNPEAMKRLFLSTINRIKQTIGDIMNHPDARDLSYMFLVGGFAESRILQSEIRREFGHILKVIIPQGVSLAILEGAVLFGWDPAVVNIRKSRLTYGIGVLNRFDPEKHPQEKKLSKNGIDWCADVFQSFVKVNQSIALGDTVLRSYTPARPGQRISIINIFCSEKTDIQFVTDPGVRCCGTLCLDLSESEYHQMPSRREIQTKMFFGDTEIKVTALDVASGKYVRAGIDFLSK